MRTIATNPGRSIARRRERARARTVAEVRRRREEPLPSWLATRTLRRSLALVPVAVIAIGVAALLQPDIPDPLFASTAVALSSVGGSLLRRATHLLDEAPDAALDEREIRVRDHAYRRGFQLTLGLVAALTAAVGLISVLERSYDISVANDVGVFALSLSVLIAASMLPAVVLAWTWRDPFDDDPRA